MTPEKFSISKSWYSTSLCALPGKTSGDWVYKPPSLPSTSSSSIYKVLVFSPKNRFLLDTCVSSFLPPEDAQDIALEKGFVVAHMKSRKSKS